MKAQFSLIVLALLATACGSNADRAAVKDAEAPAADAPAAPAVDKLDLHLAEITSIEASAPANGSITVSVSYRRDCDEIFENLQQTRLAPLSLANPHIGVGVILRGTGELCKGESVVGTETFLLPATTGVYSFEPMQSERPALGSSAQIAAEILSIETSAPVDGQVTVSVTFPLQDCSEKFQALLTAGVRPITLAAPNVAVLALVTDKGVACAGSTVPVTKTFTLPAIQGAYRFHAVK
jgi:hypothetical protein